MDHKTQEQLILAIGQAEGLDFLGVAVKIDWKGLLSEVCDYLDKLLETGFVFLIGDVYFLTQKTQDSIKSLVDEGKLTL